MLAKIIQKYFKKFNKKHRRLNFLLNLIRPIRKIRFSYLWKVDKLIAPAGMIRRLFLVPEPELHGTDVFAFIENPFLNSLFSSKHLQVLKDLEVTLKLF